MSGTVMFGNNRPHLLDTNILVYVLQSTHPPEVTIRLEELVAYPYYVSDATLIELLG